MIPAGTGIRKFLDLRVTGPDLYLDEEEGDVVDSVVEESESDDS